MRETNTESLIDITQAARDEVARLLAAENREGLGLRLGVRGGGCSGLSYVVEFGLQEPGDRVLEFSAPDFHAYLDPKSLLYLKGCRLDHQGGLSGKGFVFSNPNAENTCGCGESFSV